MNLDTVPLHDWVSLGVGIAGAVTAYLSRTDRLPAWARKWIKRIGKERIADAVERAASIIELSPDQRRRQAVIYLQKTAIKELGFPVPVSIANLLVEHAYQQWKRMR